MKYIILIVMILFLIYAVCENAFMLVVRHEKLDIGIRIAHISDLHKKRFGKENSHLCSKVEAESPDIIIISGDIVSRTQTDFSDVDKMLARLKKTAPVYVIFGNHEQSLTPEKQEELIDIISKNGAVLLRNSHAAAEIRGRSFNIYGIEPSYTVYKKDDGYNDLDIVTEKDMEDLIGRCPDGETILIAHNPFFGEAYAQWGADHTLSGHIHGGAVRLFGVGLLSPERRFFPRYAKGIYTIGNMKLLVSAGLGKLRLFNPPEIVIYD